VLVALGFCAPQVVAAAAPAPAVVTPADLASVLIAPPSPDYVARPNGLLGTTHVGPLDLEAMVAEHNGSPSWRSELVRQGFARAYRKVWVQQNTSAVLIERIEEYRYNLGAQDHFNRSRAAIPQESNFGGFFDVSPLGTAVAYGDVVVDSDHYETDNVFLLKGNLVIDVAAGRPSQDSVDLARSQATAQYAAMPDETRDQSGAPNSLPPAPLIPAGTQLSPVGLGIIGGVLLVPLIGVLLVVLVAARGRSRRPHPLLSADRRYWWDGSNWRDTAVSVPDGAPRSPDGAHWFDGVAWRPVTPTAETGALTARQVPGPRVG
jgi:hypothetical protein